MCVFSFNRAPTRATWAQAMESMKRATERFEKQYDTFTTGEAGVLVRPGEDQPPNQTKAEIERALTGMDRARFRCEVTVDELGHGWALIKGELLPEIAAGVAQMGEVFTAAGMADRIVAAVFPFRWHDVNRGHDRRLYWIYQPRIRGFTPFVPDGEPGTEERDHELEVRMEGAIRRDLPTFRETAEWYPIWGMPV